jgi:hypothetical protein
MFTCLQSSAIISEKFKKYMEGIGGEGRKPKTVAKYMTSLNGYLDALEANGKPLTQVVICK